MRMACNNAIAVVTLTLLALVSACMATIREVPSRSCDNYPCPFGKRCILQQVQCVRAPCPPLPFCVASSGGLTKPGSCPRRRPGFIGICVVNCRGDASCPGNQKCCGGCPTSCATPVFLNGEKPGSCPANPPGYGICVARCTLDTECPGEEKCCGSCPRECKAPARTKPGFCPPPLLGGFRGASWCRSAPSEVCTDDYDCEGSHKCCDNGCRSLCRGPLYNSDEA